MYVNIYAGEHMQKKCKYAVKLVSHAFDSGEKGQVERATAVLNKAVPAFPGHRYLLKLCRGDCEALRLRLRRYSVRDLR